MVNIYDNDFDVMPKFYVKFPEEENQKICTFDTYEEVLDWVKNYYIKNYNINEDMVKVIVIGITFGDVVTDGIEIRTVNLFNDSIKITDEEMDLIIKNRRKDDHRIMQLEKSLQTLEEVRELLPTIRRLKSEGVDINLNY